MAEGKVVGGWYSNWKGSKKDADWTTEKSSWNIYFSCNIEQFGKDRQALTFLINDIIFWCFSLQIKWMKNISWNICFSLKKSELENILDKIPKVNNIIDFQKLMIIANKINIKNEKILKTDLW